MMKQEFITDAKGKKKKIILDIKDFNKIIAYLEDLEDIKLVYETEREGGEPIPLEECMQDLGIKINA